MFETIMHLLAQRLPLCLPPEHLAVLGSSEFAPAFASQLDLPVLLPSSVGSVCGLLESIAGFQVDLMGEHSQEEHQGAELPVQAPLHACVQLHPCTLDSQCCRDALVRESCEYNWRPIAAR